MPKPVPSKMIRIVIVAAGFISLIFLRQFLHGFGYSVGYLYVALVALAGFWFGITGGLITAAAASAVFVIEVGFFRGWQARDLVVEGLILRLFVYFLAGVVLGYLSGIEKKRMNEIRQLSDLKSKFLGMASHDLRNPLGTIKLCLYNILERGKCADLSEEKVLRHIERIKHSVDSMSVMIDDFLDTSLIDLGKLSLRLQEDDYVKCVTENIEFNSLFADQEDINLELKVEGEIPKVMIDCDKIDQVLNNLIKNAINNSKAGMKILIKISTEDDFVVTKVIDQGPGIKEEDSVNVFMEFFQAKKEIVHRKKMRSVGLGLAIAKQIIEGHNGVIGVESVFGKGATFYFKLPIKRLG